MDDYEGPRYEMAVTGSNNVRIVFSEPVSEFGEDSVSIEIPGVSFSF